MHFHSFLCAKYPPPNIQKTQTRTNQRLHFERIGFVIKRLCHGESKGLFETNIYLGDVLTD